MWIFYLFNGLLCVWMAYRDASYIKEKQAQKIRHWLNGAVHIGVATVLWFLYGWPHFIAILAQSAFVFDVAMNIFRKLNPFYIPMKPKSWKDRADKFIFMGNGFLAKLFYLLLFIIMAFKLWNYF